jgi:hypothetical protein
LVLGVASSAESLGETEVNGGADTSLTLAETTLNSLGSLSKKAKGKKGKDEHVMAAGDWIEKRTV